MKKYTCWYRNDNQTTRGSYTHDTNSLEVATELIKKWLKINFVVEVGIIVEELDK